MSDDEKRVTVWCLRSEIQAFERDLRTRPSRGPEDVREQHLRLLRSALKNLR